MCVGGNLPSYYSVQSSEDLPGYSPQSAHCKFPLLCMRASVLQHFLVIVCVLGIVLPPVWDGFALHFDVYFPVGSSYSIRQGEERVGLGGWVQEALDVSTRSLRGSGQSMWNLQPETEYGCS